MKKNKKIGIFILIIISLVFVSALYNYNVTEQAKADSRNNNPIPEKREPPTFWTCSYCFNRNSVKTDLYNCHQCHTPNPDYINKP
jgi:hypothetical protein